MIAKKVKIKCLLITGGLGFIGSDFVRALFEKNGKLRKALNLDEDALVVIMDKWGYGANINNLFSVKYKIVDGSMTNDFSKEAKKLDKNQVLVIRGNICDKGLVNKAFGQLGIDGVINFAAESHVDRSITDPMSFMENVNGTVNLLENARKHWGENSSNKFLQVSTDEVYGSLGATGCFTEESPWHPNSPYSASKASSDAFVLGYGKTYGMHVLITRCCNNLGPCQLTEKLIPLIIKRMLEKDIIPIYGDGSNIREWIYVRDHVLGIIKVFTVGERLKVYNIGSGVERTNLEIVECVSKALGGITPNMKFVEDRKGHDLRYSVDTSLIRSLGWKPEYSFEEAIKITSEYNVSQFAKGLL